MSLATFCHNEFHIRKMRSPFILRTLKKMMMAATPRWRSSMRQRRAKNERRRKTARRRRRTKSRRRIRSKRRRMRRRGRNTKKKKKRRIGRSISRKAKDQESESDDGDEAADRIIRSPVPEADHKLKGFIDLFENAIAKYPEKGVFIDFYGGEGKAAARADSKYGLIGVVIDTKNHPAWDLHTEGVLSYISKKVSSGRVKGSHVATDCRSFSSARHGKPGDNCPRPLRDYHENTWGFPDLCGKDRATLENGNKDARLTLGLVDVFKKNQVPISVENGDNSILWHIPEMAERLDEARIFKVDYCMMGRMYRKRTRLAAWALTNTRVADQVEKQCQDKFHCLTKNRYCCATKKHHVILRGWVRGKAIASQGQVYPRKFANLITKLLLS